MTLSQFHSLADRYNESVKRADRRAGGIIAAFYNRDRASETDRVHEWWDFFSEWKPKAKEQTEEEMFQMMMLFTKQREGLSH